jgi:hypothetical protein
MLNSRPRRAGRRVRSPASDGCGLVFTALIDFASTAEIGDFDVPFVCQQDVLRTQIPMQHSWEPVSQHNQ